MAGKIKKLTADSSRHSGPFLILPENRLAYEGTLQLLDASPGSSQCLLFLSGFPGSGKSHLVRNCLREFQQKNKQLNYQFLLVSEYADAFAESIDNHSVDQFEERFENCEFLILEDLTSIQGRRQTQKHLVSTIDHILKNGGKCLISSTKMPGELKSINSKLVNRCHGGITVEIRNPGKQSREKLLNQMISFLKIPVYSEGVQRLAESCQVSPLELKSTLIQLEASSKVARKPINKEFIQSFLAGEVTTPAPSLTEITRSVSRQLQVSVKNIRSTSRLKGHVFARQCAMYLMRELTKNSLEKIADYFHRKNHSTVTHACNKIESLEKENITVNHQLKQIRCALGFTRN